MARAALMLRQVEAVTTHHSEYTTKFVNRVGDFVVEVSTHLISLCEEVIYLFYPEGFDVGKTVVLDYGDLLAIQAIRLFRILQPQNVVGKDGQPRGTDILTA
jgi:hypothetical protein